MGIYYADEDAGLARWLIKKSAAADVVDQRLAALEQATRLDWTALDWTPLDWTGVVWSGLDWTGVVWTGLDQRLAALDAP